MEEPNMGARPTDEGLEPREITSPPNPKIDAQKLARKIGDEEWKKGNTKYALEAWEASGITIAELLELARKLLEAEKITATLYKDIDTAFRLPQKSDPRFMHSAFNKNCAERGCIRCKAHLDLLADYDQKISELLGFAKGEAGRVFNIGAYDADKTVYRAAAVACLKLIKRMAR